MSEMWEKKGKNFKEYIEEDKNKGKTIKAIMRAITSIHTSILYGGSFLTLFVVTASLLYMLFSPSVYIWAGLLVLVALISSLVANRVTNILKNSQWKYKA